LSLPYCYKAGYYTADIPIVALDCVTRHRKSQVLDKMILASCGQSFVCLPCSKEQTSPKRWGCVGPNSGHVVYFGPMKFSHRHLSAELSNKEASSLTGIIASADVERAYEFFAYHCVDRLA
jgi:hypothetical protein